MPSWSIVTAGALVAGDIGKMIRVRVWNNTTEVANMITAELREISHEGSGVSRLTYGQGSDRTEVVVVDHGQPISLNPPADYSDAVELSCYDEKV